MRRVTSNLPLPVALLPAVVLLAIVYAYPLGQVIAGSLIVRGQVSLDRYVHLVETPVFPRILWRTIRISALVTGLSLMLGYPLAYWLSRLRPRSAVPLLIVVTLPFFTSVLVRTYSWVVILSMNGVVNRSLMAVGLISEPVRLVHNELGVVIGMLQIQLPLMVLPVYGVMHRIDRSLVLAAQSLGAPPGRAFWDVFRPLSMPGVTTGCTLVFVSSLGFFVTPALMGGPGEYLVTQSIEARMTTVVDFGAATAQATVLLVAIAVLMTTFRRPLGLLLESTTPHSSSRVASQSSLHGRPYGGDLLIGSWVGLFRDVRTLVLDGLLRVAAAVRAPALALISGVTLMFLALPMVVVAMLAFSDAPYLTFPPPAYSLRWFRSYFADPAWVRSTVFSLVVATGAAMVATTLGTLAAFPLVRSARRGSDFIYLLFVSPLIIPHLIVALALFLVMAPIGLIGHPAAFVAAYCVLGLPYSVVVMTAALQRFDESLEHAAASLGASPIRVVASVTLPLLWPSVTSAFVFAFLAGFDDVVVALFLSGPEAITLSIRMWEDIRLEISPKIAAVSVLLLAGTLAALFVSGARSGWWGSKFREEDLR